MKLKDFNTEEHFKQSFKKVFGEDIDISLDTTFGELAEMQRLMLEKAEKNSKEHGAMSVVGATQEDLRRMGLSAGASEEVAATSLAKEASKKDGSLDMEDLIKIHEKGHL